MTKPYTPGKPNPLTNFLEGCGDKPYRQLVEYHLRRQSLTQLRAAPLGEISLLPEHLRGLIEGYMDGIFLRFGYDNDFWEMATCKQAFELIMEAAMEMLPIKDIITSRDDAFRSENQELAFSLFQIATSSFAYNARLQRNARKFMGIRKSIFDYVVSARFIIADFPKRWKISQISRKLGKPRSIETRDRALDDLIDFIQDDELLSRALIHYKLDRDGLKEIYEQLLLHGAGQWVRGNYVAASALTEFGALTFLLEQNKSSFREHSRRQVSFILVEYFDLDPDAIKLVMSTAFERVLLMSAEIDEPPA